MHFVGAYANFLEQIHWHRLECLNKGVECRAATWNVLDFVLIDWAVYVSVQTKQNTIGKQQTIERNCHILQWMMQSAIANDKLFLLVFLRLNSNWTLNASVHVSPQQNWNYFHSLNGIGAVCLCTWTNSIRTTIITFIANTEGLHALLPCLWWK